MNFHSPKHQNQSRGDKCISQAAHVKTKINNHWLANQLIATQGTGYREQWSTVEFSNHGPSQRLELQQGD